MKRLAKAAVSALLLTGLLLCACGCGRLPDGGNRPYEPDTPEPSPHSGVFISEHGSMTFNGDGKTVRLDFDEDLAGRLGLPAGKQEAVYEFRSGNLPPHGYIPVRYDTAMTFWITLGDGGDALTVMVEVGEYKDGKYYTGTNCTEADRITFFTDKPEGGREPVDFRKK